MSFLVKMQAKLMAKSVRTGLSVASEEKLQSHINTCKKVISTSNDYEVQAMLQELVLVISLLMIVSQQTSL